MTRGQIVLISCLVGIGSVSTAAAQGSPPIKQATQPQVIAGDSFFSEIILLNSSA